MEIAIFAALCLAALGYMIFQNTQNKKRIIQRLNKMYGNPRENIAERYERIDQAALYYLLEEKNISDVDKIDDITWNDLGMDDIFITASHTDSYAGEQYLYSVMHRLDMTDQELAENDKRAEFFDSNEGKRSEVRKLLYGLGQSISGFALPDNIHSISEKHLKHRKLIPVLAVLPIVLAVAGLLLRIKMILFLALLAFIANMIIHTLLKGDLDISLQTIFNSVCIINTADKISDEVPELSSDIEKELNNMRPILKKALYFVACKNAEITNNYILQLIFFVINCFMADFIMYDMIIDGLESKTAEFMNIYSYTGRMDYVISLASYRRYIGEYCKPEFTDKNTIEFKGLYHPLIKNAVSNDLSCNRSMIITGSNASGKSTFIKSAALSLILGQTLHTCHAENAVLPRCGVMTSMALNDDILSGESYYIREIRYLKRMVELCGEDKLMFLAVDEILRGTNTRERIAASKAVLEYFAEKHCIIMVATHDMEIAEYFDSSCDNYHFCETVEEGDVVFDYKLHEGMSKTSNAIRLLGAMGFPDSIVSNAENYSKVIS